MPAPHNEERCSQRRYDPAGVQAHRYAQVPHRSMPQDAAATRSPQPQSTPQLSTPVTAAQAPTIQNPTEFGKQGTLERLKARRKRLLRKLSRQSR